MTYEEFLKDIKQFRDKNNHHQYISYIDVQAVYDDTFAVSDYTETWNRTFDEDYNDICESYDDNGEYPKSLESLKAYLVYAHSHIDYDLVMKNYAQQEQQESGWDPYSSGVVRILYVKYKDLYKYIQLVNNLVDKNE